MLQFSLSTFFLLHSQVNQKSFIHMGRGDVVGGEGHSGIYSPQKNRMCRTGTI